jgi:Zn-dependent M28 family amino/carboxypeptidase
VLLEVARALSAGGSERTIRFAFFPGGAGAAAATEDRGSAVYARRCKERNEKVIAMLALDSLGVYSTRPKSQSVPFPLGPVYPDTGNFVCFAGDLSARGLVAKCTEIFRKDTRFAAYGVALPSFLPSIGTGDDAAFRGQGYPAIRVTDTGSLRHEHNGRISDTPDRLDYASAARVTNGIARVAAELAKRTNGVL